MLLNCNKIIYFLYSSKKRAPVNRHAYDLNLKLKAINYAKEHGNRAEAREFNINESMVQKWKKQENALSQVKKTQLSFQGHKARWPKLEDKLEQWVVEQRTAGRSVSTVLIKLKAVAIVSEMKINDFRGGPSWCFHFMKRCHLYIRTRTTMSQQLPSNYKEKLALFRTYCSNKISENKNNQNTLLTWMRYPHIQHTYEPHGRKTGKSVVTIQMTGNEKPTFTVVLSCQADGQKLSPMVIFKRKTLPKEKFLTGVTIKTNPKGWMNKEMMSAWLREVYVKRPDGFFHMSKFLLIYDSMHAHLTDSVKAQVKKQIRSLPSFRVD